MASDRDVGPPPGSRGLLSSLRYTADEVQFGRALALVCRDPLVAAALCEAVIDKAPSLAAVGKPSSGVSCVAERVLSGRVTRGRLRRGHERLGRADLDFRAGARWRLIVELKIDSGLGIEQLERYSVEAPVAVIVRDPGAISLPADLPNPVGAVAWQDLVGDLRSLPIRDSALSCAWSELLDVMVADGDFAVAKGPSMESEEAREILQAASPALLKGVRRALRSRYGDRTQDVSDELTAGRTGVRSGWARVEIRDAREWWLLICLRDAWDRNPHMRVYFSLAPSPREKRRLRAELARLDDLEIERLPNDYKFDGRLMTEDEPLEEAVVRTFSRKFEEVVGLGVYDLVFPD